MIPNKSEISSRQILLLVVKVSLAKEWDTTLVTRPEKLKATKSKNLLPRYILFLDGKDLNKVVTVP